MPFTAIATPLTLLAVALPFLFCGTQAPISNFWPLLFSWGCAALLIVLALVSGYTSSAAFKPPGIPDGCVANPRHSGAMAAVCALPSGRRTAFGADANLCNQTPVHRPAATVPATTTTALAARPEASSAWAIVAAGPLAVGLLCAALLAGAIGLLQYFLGDISVPGLQASTPGQAIGNLRQRNQQASLLSIGLWALLWLSERQAPRGSSGGVVMG